MPADDFCNHEDPDIRSMWRMARWILIWAVIIHAMFFAGMIVELVRAIKAHNAKPAPTENVEKP